MPVTKTCSLADLYPTLLGLFPNPEKVNWVPLLKSVGGILEQESKLCFQFGRSPLGAPWKPLAHPRPRTKHMGKADASKGEYDHPLRDTDRLMASLTSQPKKLSDHVATVQGTLLEWGSNVEYGAFHQWGTSRITQREFLGISDGAEEDISQAILSHYVTESEKS